jgi:hypothetical protein
MFLAVRPGRRRSESAQGRAVIDLDAEEQAASMRITIYTPGSDDQGDWDVESYSIEGGALRLFSADGELAAYSPLGWTQMQVRE